MIKTECKNCVFAVKDDGSQRDCSLGKLDIFIEKNAKVQYIDNNFEIIDRICLFCRDKKWAKEDDFISLENRINKEVEIKHSFVILYNKDDSFSSLFETLQSIEKQTLAPYEIYVVNNSHRYIDSKKIFAVVRDLFDKKCKYFVNTIFNKFNEATVYDNDYLMNIYLSKIGGNWFTLLTLPSVVNKEFSYNLNYLLNEELEKFSVLIPSEGLSGLTAQTFTAKALGGNNLEVEEDEVLLNLIEKLRYYNKKHSFDMVKSLEEICPIN